MDVLDTLKKEWQSRDQKFPKLSYDEIYSMLLKKSSSVVKWIFIISICELLFWILISLLVPDSTKEFNEQMGLKNFYLISGIVNNIIIIGFLYLFYKNYRSIKVTNTVKELMESILKTRKTVRFFVYYNIIATALFFIGVNIYYFLHKEQLSSTLSKSFGEYGLDSGESATMAFLGAQVIVGVVFMGLLILFYYLLYGILLKRLKRNYRELKKIEL